METLDREDLSGNSHGVECNSRPNQNSQAASLAIGDAANRSEALEFAATHILANLPSEFVGRVAMAPRDGVLQPEFQVIKSNFPELPVNLPQWATTLAIQAISQGKARVECVNESENVTLVAVPNSQDDNGEVIVSLFVGGTSDGLIETQAIESAIHSVQRWDFEQKSSGDQCLSEDIAAISSIGSNLESVDDLKSACQHLANGLVDYLKSIHENKGGADPAIQSFVATVDENGTVKLVAMSDRDGLPENTETIEVIESAMAEAICRNENSAWPPLNGARHSLLCHQKLAKVFTDANLLSLPFADAEGKSQGVVVVCSEARLAQRQKRFCEACSQTLGTKFRLIRRAEQNRIEKLIQSLRSSFRSQKAKTLMKLSLVVFGIGMIPMPHQITSDCEICPTTRRFVCAPFQASLDSCAVEPGDLVCVGDVLAELDDREIRLELAENEAELSRARNNNDRYLASHESGEARMAQLEAERLLARNQLLKNRINNLQLKSPMDGVVIAGDLKDVVGMPLDMGESLFEVAPLDDLVVEVHVSDDDVRYLKSDMQVRLQFDALPFQTFSGSVLRIHPTSELRNGKNVFVATASIRAPAAEMRPGMHGNAKVKSVWRPIAWNYLHKPFAKCLRWVGW